MIMDDCYTVPVTEAAEQHLGIGTVQSAKYSSGNVYISNTPSSFGLAKLARPYIYGGEEEGVESLSLDNRKRTSFFGNARYLSNFRRSQTLTVSPMMAFERK